MVLPDGVLETIEQHIIGIADWSQELLSAGQHLKRGLLLHGPPGTGKTHTVRYLTGRLADSTVILLTGRSIRFIDQAAALARRLQPSMVVLEDVDLVATDRDYTPDGNPLLFSLLDAMDGVGADADVTFVLTTNRADILETALADRPGRVDLAVEIPRPDAGCRERLLRVYVRDLPLDADLDPVVAGTEGVTASFVKEMIRRTVLVSLRAGERPPVLRDAHFAEVLAEMNSERHALTRSLLGVGSDGGGTGRGGATRPSGHPGPSDAGPLSPFPVRDPAHPHGEAGHLEQVCSRLSIVRCRERRRRATTSIINARRTSGRRYKRNLVSRSEEERAHILVLSDRGRHQRVGFRSRFAAHRLGVPGPASSRHRECLGPAALASPARVTRTDWREGDENPISAVNRARQTCQFSRTASWPTRVAYAHHFGRDDRELAAFGPCLRSSCV